MDLSEWSSQLAAQKSRMSPFTKRDRHEWPRVRGLPLLWLQVHGSIVGVDDRKSQRSVQLVHHGLTDVRASQSEASEVGKRVQKSGPGIADARVG